jgi:hypothetical protein
MATVDGENKGQDYNIVPIRRPRRKTWFLNGELVRITHTSRAAGIVTLYNCTKDITMTTTVAEFKKKRKRAFTVTETAQLLNYHRKSMPRLVKRGLIPPPVGELPGGQVAWHYLSYYSEDTIMEARKLMAQTHHGKARKDGLVTNNKVPTEQELRYAMGDGMMMYIKNEQGQFIPVFSETL